MIYLGTYTMFEDHDPSIEVTVYCGEGPDGEMEDLEAHRPTGATVNLEDIGKAEREFLEEWAKEQFEELARKPAPPYRGGTNWNGTNFRE